MNLLWTLAAMTLAYASLQYGLLKPAKKKGWPSSDAAAVAKAGVLAALTTLVNFLQLAVIVYACAAIVFGMLSWTAPMLSAAALVAAHGFLSWLKGWTDSLGDSFDSFLLWISVAATVYFVWRARRTDFRALLRDEYRKQLDELVEKVRRGEELPPLAPTREMLALAAQIQAVEQAIPSATDDSNRESLQRKLTEMQNNLLFLDLLRRVDLTSVPIDDEDVRGWWPRLRLAFLSKGTMNTATWLSKWLGRTGQAVALILVLGVAAPTINALAIAPALNNVTDLAVLAQEKDAENSLQALANAAKEKPDQDQSPIPISTYRALARQLLNATARSPVWQSEAHKADPKAHVQAASDVDHYARRDAILHDFADTKFGAAPSDVGPAPSDFGSSTGESAAPSGPDTPDAGTPTGDGAKRYGAYRDRIYSGGETVSDGAVDRCAEWLRAASHTSRRAHDAILAWGRSFQEPGEAWDYFSEPLGELTSKAAEFAIPDPKGQSFLDKKLRKAPRKTLEAAVERFTKAKLNSLLQAMLGKGDIQAALDDIRIDTSASFVLGAEEHVQLQELMAAREADAARIAELPGPGLEPIIDEVDMRTTREAVDAISPLSESSQELRNLYEEASGSYTDIFPPSTDALDRTALGRAVAGRNGAMQQADAADAVARARDFSRLSVFSKNGGVVIGHAVELAPDNVPRDVTWSVHGRMLDLTLVDGKGKAIPLGSYRGQIVQQALAFAADGRQTVATILNNDAAQVQRIFVHPVFTNTQLGNEMIAIDLFVFDGVKDVMFVGAERQAEEQLMLYKQAYAIATSDAGAHKWLEENADRDSLAGLEAARSGADRASPKPPSQIIAEVFPDGWQVDDGAQSLFSAYPSRFDFDLVRAMQTCGRRAGNGNETFWSCVGTHKVNTDQYVAQNGGLVSGVRDIRLGIGQVYGYLRMQDRTLPLYFLMQTVFPEARSSAAEMPETAPVVKAHAAEKSWQFPQLGNRVENGTRAYILSSPLRRQILQDVRSFTLLQAVFRALLDDDALPQSRLKKLMGAAREVDALTKEHTPVWNDFAHATAERANVLKQINAVRTKLLLPVYERLAADPKYADNRSDIERCSGFLREQPAERVFGSDMSAACPANDRLMALFKYPKLIERLQARLTYVNVILADPQEADFEDKNPNLNRTL
jgi:hypothetical protein